MNCDIKGAISLGILIFLAWYIFAIQPQQASYLLVQYSFKEYDELELPALRKALKQSQANNRGMRKALDAINNCVTFDKLKARCEPMGTPQ